MRASRFVRAFVGSAVVLAIAAPVADAATVRWGQDRSPVVGEVVVKAAPGEVNDLTIRAADGPPGHPTAVIVEDRGATLTTSGTAVPGECDEGWTCDVPCRIEAPNRARCVIDDGFTTERPVNPLKPANHSFYRTTVFLEDGDDRLTVPLDNVWQRMAVHTADGDNSYDLARGAYTVWTSSGDTIKFGPGASGGAEINGRGVSVEAVNGSPNYAYCYGAYAPKLRFDLHDGVSHWCSDGDIVPPYGTLEPVRAPPDEESVFYMLGRNLP